MTGLSYGTRELNEGKIAEGDISGGMASGHSGTSIFDPVLCELATLWFSPPGGLILDPFAGGSVRGIVASRLGRRYFGVDLRIEQIEANIAQAHLATGPAPIWKQGDSRGIKNIVGRLRADMIFSCPPYADLEIYSDDPADISNMPYEKFRAAYFEIIKETCALLKDDRFAVFVVGDARGPDGFYYGLPEDTVLAFRAAGLGKYNEAILVTAVGSLPIRAAAQFVKSRKLGKTHQNVLVFCKGDPVKATAAIGPVEFERGEEDDEEDGLGQDNQPAPAVATRPIEVDFKGDATPIEKHGPYWLKRDDLFSIAGAPGGKARTCWALAQGASGLVTAGSRASPQVNIVAKIGAHLGIPVRAHTPTGQLSPEVRAAQDSGAEIIQHKYGRNSVIISKARLDCAARLGWREIPFGMECPEAVVQTSRQVLEIPAGVKRIVVPVGSGMSLAGVLTGLRAIRRDIPVLGVVVGANPEKRLDKFAPKSWRDMAELIPAGVDYHRAVKASVGGVLLDAHYEAKCKKFLRAGDLLWIVGIRATALT